MEIADIIKVIDNVDREDLTTILDACRQRSGVLTQRATMSFKPGDEVTFTHQGRTILAIVDKTNTKTVNLHEKSYLSGKWKVSPGLLTKV
jgi:hypothetical protein